VCHAVNLISPNVAGEPSGPGQTPCVYVWVGQYFEECNYMDPVECNKFAARFTSPNTF